MTDTPMLKTVWFNAALFKDRPELIQGALTATSQADACLQLYTGVQAENADFAAWLSFWKSNDEHDIFLSLPHAGQPLQAELRSIAGDKDAFSGARVYLIDPITALELAVKAPATEVVQIRLNPEHSSALKELDALMEELRDTLQGDGAHAACRGKKVGDETTYVLVIGWDSVQAHWDAVAEGTKGGDVVKRFQQIATIEYLKHTTFSKLK